MKTIQQRIRARLLETQQQQPDRIPSWLRTLLRASSGGSDWTAKFVRGMLWKYRWLIGVALLANVGSGFAEATTLGLVTLVLNQMTALASDATVDTSGTLNTLVSQIANLLGGQEPTIILVILAVVVQLIRASLDYGGQAATIVLRVWLESDLQRRIFSEFVGTRYQRILNSHLGNLTSYTTQANEVGTAMQALNQTLNDFTIIVAYTAVLFWLSWQFTLVAIVIMALLTLSLNRLRDSIRDSIQGFVNITINVNEHILEYLQGLRLVHIFVREKVVINEVNDLINSGIKPRRIAFLRRALIGPIFQSITIIGIALFLGVGYWAINTAGMLLVGELAAYVYVIYRIMPRIASINVQFGAIATQWPYIVRIAELLNPEVRESEYLPGKRLEKLQKGIEFRNVDLLYPEAERNALNQLSFHLPVGKMLALVGPSGSGKSSVINLILGIYRPTAGAILIDDADLYSYDIASWRRQIGVVDQDTLVFSNTVAENIRFGKPDATDTEVADAAKIAHADLFINEMPQQYETKVGDRGHRLSGGQRQRIAIARAIINSPPLLLFDEATSALDSLSERLIQESLEELRKERTVIIIAHRLSTIVKADQIILLDDGQMIERGTHQELMAQNGRYAAMWRLQANAA